VTDDAQGLIAAIQTAAESVRMAETDLARRRADYRRAIADAHAAGVSLAAIGRELGITRQRVKRIIDEA
jgi:hypothetical protein